jgi:peptide/nickel transport system permease protein
MSIATPAAVLEAAPRRTDTWAQLVRQACRLGRTRVGLALVAVVVAIAVVGPYVAPHSATGFQGAPFASPSAAAPLGTDYLGRDVLSRFLDGGRTVLLLALVSTVLGVSGGTIVGLVAGYTLRAADEVLMRTMDLLLAFPSIILILLLVSIVGPATWLLVLVVALSYTPPTARVIRAATLQVRDLDFVKYAEAIGVPRLRILLGEILPNIVAPLTVEFGLRMTYSIGLIASLDYLGFGAQPPRADWGLMIKENQAGLNVAPWAVLLPVAVIALITIGSNLVTDGLGRAVAGIDRRVEV